MKKLTRQEKHEQCMREIRGTLIVVLICCAWHIASAFLLNGTSLYFLGMPAWFSVSTFGTIILSLIGVWYLLKHVFINFDYDDEEEEEDMVRYNTVDEMPSYYREEVAQLVDSGALQGDNNGDLNVSEDMIRGAIIGMRYAEARNPHYYSLDDVPSWAREETQRLIDRGALQGDGKHELNVTYDALQAMIVC